MLVELKEDIGVKAEYPNRYSPIPPNGQQCPFTGLKHAKLYQLLKGEAKKNVRVVNLREDGATRGKTLFHVGDMLKWLDSLATGGAR
jgi:hypothetical protein